MLDPLKIFHDVAISKFIDKKWTGKLNEGFKHLANTSKGDAAEEFIKIYTQGLGFNSEKNLKRLGDWDVKINEKKFEVKCATEDISGSFQFNHIRFDYKYDFLLCLGVAPNNLLFRIWSKGDVATDKAGTMVSMGRGQNSSFKLTKKASSLYTIEKLQKTLSNLLRIHT
jgi:hypothetical protein